MSEYDYNTAYWIKNSFIIVSILTTVITMGLISQRKYLDDMAKYKRTQRYISLLADPFVLRMFLVQACYFIMGIIDITFTPDIGDTQCKVVGALFYWFALSSFLLIDYFLLAILVLLLGKQKKLKRYEMWVLVGIFTVPAYNFIMYDSYKKCGIGEFFFYCGVCNQGEPTWVRILVSLDYFTPIVASIILSSLIMFHKRRISRQQGLNEQEQLRFNTVLIPTLDIFCVLLNALITLVIPKQGINFYLLLSLDCLLYIPPMIDLLLYYFFIKEFRKLNNTCWWWKAKELEKTVPKFQFWGDRVN